MPNAIKCDSAICRPSVRPWLGILFSSLLSAVLASPVCSEPAVAEQGAATVAQPKSTVAEGTPSRPADKPYYIEFRARNAQTYGHTFSIYGRVNANGKIATSTVAGLHPFTESALPWMVGHLVVVPSETGASDGDKDDQYVLARFQVALSADEYKKVVGYIKELQAKSPMWHAVLYNCNAFVGDIAKFMGMETPASTLLMPADYIDGLRKLNISKKTGIIGTPIAVGSAERLREAALKAVAARGKKVAAPSDGGTKTSDHKPTKQAQVSSGSATAKPNNYTDHASDVR